MTQSNTLERLEELIGVGEAVLKTRRPPPPRLITSDSVDSAKFEKWRMSSLNLLSAAFGESSNNFKEFSSKCKIAHFPDAEKGLSILLAVRSDLLAGVNSAGRKALDIGAIPLHPRIASVCLKLFNDGYYSNAVYDASKALVNLVKEQSGNHELDGAPLMRMVFSRKSPVLAFNDLQDQSDQDEQEGMMHLYEGVALGIRNPRGHDFPEDTPERAFEYICLISLLANRVEEAHRTDK